MGNRFRCLLRVSMTAERRISVHQLSNSHQIGRKVDEIKNQQVTVSFTAKVSPFCWRSGFPAFRLVLTFLWAFEGTSAELPGFESMVEDSEIRTHWHFGTCVLSPEAFKFDSSIELSASYRARMDDCAKLFASLICIPALLHSFSYFSFGALSVIN